VTEAAWIAITLLGVVGSALCSGLETGFYSLGRITLGVRAAGDRPDRAARVLAGEVARPEAVLASLLVGNNVFNYLGSLGVAGLLAAAGLGDAAVVAVGALVLTPTLVVFGESFPKELFRLHADRLLYRFAAPMRTARLALTVCGIVPGIVACARAAARLTGAEAQTGLSASARQHVASLLREGHGLGLISGAQASLVERALTFGSLVVGDVLVPWSRVASVGLEWDRGRIARLLDQRPHGVLPVVDRRRRVVGVVPSIDLLLEPDRPVVELVRAPELLAPDTPIELALTRLRGARLAVVGSPENPLGIVTAKDLVEPLTGELASW